MLTMLIGIFIWTDAHLFKRILPPLHKKFYESLGRIKANAVIAGLIFLSIILMVIGYRAWDDAPVVYSPSLGLKHFAMLLAWIGVVLQVVPHSKSRIRLYLRNPMLLGFGLWAFAHLLVRGDLASVILFGAFILWALISTLLINVQTSWERPDPSTQTLIGDIRVILLGSAITAVAVAIHIYGFGLIR